MIEMHHHNGEKWGREQIVDMAFRIYCALRSGYSGVDMQCYNSEEVLEIAALLNDDDVNRVRFSWWTWGDLVDECLVKRYLYLRREAARAARC